MQMSSNSFIGFTHAEFSKSSISGTKALGAAAAKAKAAAAATAAAQAAAAARCRDINYTP